MIRYEMLRNQLAELRRQQAREPNNDYLLFMVHTIRNQFRMFPFEAQQRKSADPFVYYLIDAPGSRSQMTTDSKGIQKIIDNWDYAFVTMEDDIPVFRVIGVPANGTV